GERTQRLGQEFKVSMVYCTTQATLDAKGRLEFQIHIAGVKSILTTSVALCGIERQVGVAQQPVGACAVPREQGDSDAGVDAQLMILNDKRPGQQLEDRLRHDRGM